MFHIELIIEFLENVMNNIVPVSYTHLKHEIKGRLRVHILQSRMSFAQADTLQYYLDGQKNIVLSLIHI